MSKKFQIIILMVLLMLGGCGEPPATNNGIPVKIYKHAMDGAPGSLDPAQATSLYANFAVVNLYDTLYRYKYLARPYQLQPNLASAMPEVSADGLRLTIKIKKGVYFIADPVFEGGVGREVKAQDFVYSIKRHFDPKTRAQGAWLWQNRIAGLDHWKKEGEHAAPWWLRPTGWHAGRARKRAKRLVDAARPATLDRVLDLLARRAPASSGTEPKVKFYMFTCDPPELSSDLEAAQARLAERLSAIEQDLLAFSGV